MFKTTLVYSIILISMVLSNSYKEPEYALINKDGTIEIRQYSEYVIAKTSINQGDIEENSNMFRTLAGYIFEGNADKQSIPMTAPVITQNNDSNYEMIFFMLDVDEPEKLPAPNNEKVTLEKIVIGKTVSIRFGLWATEKRVSYYKKILDGYIKENDLKIDSELMIAQYTSPWTLPPFRKNELIYKIK